MRGYFVIAATMVAGVVPVTAAVAAPVSATLTGVVSPAVMALRVTDAHVAETAAGGSVAISMVVTNPGKTSLTLTGAATPMAGQTLLQQYVKGADLLYRLRSLEQIDIPPQFDLVLAPGGLELQLVGVTADLEAGFDIPLTLKFSDGSQRTVRVAVTVEKNDHDQPATDH